MPTPAPTAMRAESTTVRHRPDAVNRPRASVASTFWPSVPAGAPFGSSTSTAGNSRKATTRATATPSVIIQPKSMTGTMPEVTSEPKATMVVSAV